MVAVPQAPQTSIDINNSLPTIRAINCNSYCTQGMALLPMPGETLPEEEKQNQQSEQHQQPDALLVRASFVGDLFLDPCFFFTPIPDRQQQPPQQIPLSVPIADAAVRHRTEGQTERKAKGEADRQADGQPERQTYRQGTKAEGPLRPTTRRQTGEAMLKAVGVSARQAPPCGNAQANPSRTEVRTPPVPKSFALHCFFLLLVAAEDSVQGPSLAGRPAK